MPNILSRWMIAITSGGIAAAIWYSEGEYLLPQSAKAQAIHRAVPMPPNAKNPIPVDVGKGVEARLDQLLDAIKNFTLDALKAAYFQGALHGAIITSLIFTILLAFTRKGAP
jgi:hypothetical protein